MRDDFSRETTVDEFEDAFNEASGGEEQGQKPGATTDGAAPADAPAAQGGDVTTAEGGDKPAEGASQESQEQAPADAPADAPTLDPVKLQQKISTLQGMLTKVSADVKAEREARLAAEEAARKAAEEASKKPAEPPAATTESAEGEDEELLAELRESSPLLAKAIEAMMRRERKTMEQVLADKYGKTIEQVKADLTPIKERIETQAASEHEQTIEQAHPGYKQIVESQSFLDWARSQPSYVVKELVRVSQEGTAQEVIEVLDSYRKSVPATQTTAPAASGEKDLAAARRAAQREAVTGVTSRPMATSTAGLAKNDFDAAFDEAASTQ